MQCRPLPTTWAPTPPGRRNRAVGLRPGQQLPPAGTATRPHRPASHGGRRGVESCPDRWRLTPIVAPSNDFPGRSKDQSSSDANEAHSASLPRLSHRPGDRRRRVQYGRGTGLALPSLRPFFREDVGLGNEDIDQWAGFAVSASRVSCTGQVPGRRAIENERLTPPIKRA